VDITPGYSTQMSQRRIMLITCSSKIYLRKARENMASEQYK